MSGEEPRLVVVGARACEKYTLVTLPGSRFCDKQTARTAQALVDLYDFRGSVLTAAALDHGLLKYGAWGSPLHLDPDDHEAQCVFCWAESTYR